MRAKKITKETLLQLDVVDRGFDSFSIGDTVSVSQVILEGGKERIQLFEGYVIARHNKGLGSTFTVRKMSVHGIYVERIFPYFSPLVRQVKRVTQGAVRRAKLYYIRDRIGKHARIKEKRIVGLREKNKIAATSKNTVGSSETFVSSANQ